MLFARSSREPVPKRRSNTSRGFDSGVAGCVGERQEMLNW
jgi:hypothetical protein